MLLQRSKEHTFPHLEEAQAFEGATLLAIKIAARKADCTRIRHAGRKRRRLSCYAS